jgi:acyl-CoA reductase-like NAD-dependent aldehyde dehydrogenase
MDNVRCVIDEPVGLFVDGELLNSSSGSTFDSINPSNGSRLRSIPVGSAEDVDRAVASARRAFMDGRWSAEAPSTKKKALHRLADLISTDAATLDVLDAGEMGKPIGERRFNAESAAGLMRFYAEAVDKSAGDVFCSDRRSFVTQHRVPRGVVAAVVPWNFPTFVAVLKIAPALAAGNSVLLKPSELSSRSAMRLGRLALMAGVPPGVLNVVPGRGATVGQALGLHMGIDMIAFTGSTEVGKRMLQYSGQSNMKVVAAECGGKSPQIVFNDGVDLEVAAAEIAQSFLINQGQVCSAGSRLLVHRSIEAIMLDKVTRYFRNVVIGDALDRRTTFGPLANAEQCRRVMQYIETARGDGARSIIGGNRALQDSGGYFVEPTVFSEVKPTARIAQEEIFGPVLTVIPFEDEAEAVSIANATIYGLIAYVWTADLSRGLRMAKGIRSSVLVNACAPVGEGPGHALCLEPSGQSGLGAEGGIAGMESYMRRQLVWINHG